ncbi:hypothetical protein JCM1841_000345 [Sporobolomyces salmonicolor]
MPVPPPSSPPLSHLSTSDLRHRLAPITLAPGTAASVFTNWATTFRSQTEATFRPTEVEQVRWVVELARREARELRAAGAGHSPSDIVCTGGYVVDLRGVDRVLDIDAATETFHAEGGILLRNLHPILQEADLALSSLGSISDQTLAGAISTSTHGSGVTFGSLSTYVTFLDLILPLPDAPVVRVSREQDLDLFMSALCGLGTVGVIVGVGMRAEKAFRLEEECFSMTFETFQRYWREVAESAEHVRCWWFPQIGRVKVSRLNRTTKVRLTPSAPSLDSPSSSRTDPFSNEQPITPPPNPLKSWLIDRFISHHVHAVALFLSRYFPSILPYHAHVMWNLVNQPGPLRWKELFGRVEWPTIKAVEGVRQVRESGEKTPLFERKKPLSGLATPPADMITPPRSPLALSPVISSSSSRSPSPLSRDSSFTSPSSLDSMADSFHSNLALPAAELGDELETNRSIPWPILEDEPTYRVDTSIGIFNYDCGFPQYTYESSIPYAQTGSALSALEAWHTRELHNSQGYQLKAHFPIEIRWTEEDDVWLSPTYGIRGTYLGAIQYRPFNLPVPYRSCFSTFASILAAFSGRPHWAKTHTLTPSVLARTYPRFGDFLVVRERVDPHRILVNGYVRRHLLGLGATGETLEKEREDAGWETRSREWKARKLVPGPEGQAAA